MEQYQIQALTFVYPGQSVPTLDHLDLTVERGEFFTLFGPSGCGKTTLLRQLKPALAPHGARSGEILFRGHSLSALSRQEQASAIGFVLQSPEEQIVTDKVWHELAFGLESLGLPRDVIRTRVAEMAAFFGIESWFHRDTASLSGGEKQLLNLASVMAMGPEVLLLDEPTSQLDPIAAQTFLDCLARLNRELGTTILLSEHRLEDALPLSTRCALLDGGCLRCVGTPGEVGHFLRVEKHPMFCAMPTPMRVWAAVDGISPCPVTPREGRLWLEHRVKDYPPALLSLPVSPPRGKSVLDMEDVWFRYRQEGADVLRGLSLSVPQGSLTAILGGNGAGKTTLLSLITGAKKPVRGSLSLLGRPLGEWSEETLFYGALAVLPQDPKALFVGRTVAEDLADMGASSSEVSRVSTLCQLDGLLERHPYDLSGGEQQRAALAKVLLSQPKVLLMDEPTKGMDPLFKNTFASILADLRRDGVTVVMVSHDVEFCARHATCCALLFDGIITSSGEPHFFFSKNRFYTTSACRMAQSLVPGVVTAEELIFACGGSETALSMPQKSSPGDSVVLPTSAASTSKQTGRLLRPLGLLLLLLLLTAAFFSWRGNPLLAELASGALLPSLVWLGAAALGLRLLGLGHKMPKRPPVSLSSGNGRARWMTAVFLLVLAPLTLIAGTYLLEDRKYYFISLLLLLEAIAPMLLYFEGRKPQSRELVVLAVLTALAAAGRAAFFMLPQFKPVAAVVILSGVAFGGQAGFLVGAASMLVSNFFYVQGAWTPWQMAAMGLVGLGAGWLGRWVGRNRLSLCAYGFFSVVLLYGGILNPASVLMYQPQPTWEMLAASWALGFPLDLVHSAATGFFLWSAGPALLNKLDRVRVKYGLGNGA